MLQARKTSIFSACTRKEPAAEPFVALRLPDLAVNRRQRRLTSMNFRDGLPMTPPRRGWDMPQHHSASTSGCPTSVYGAVGTDFDYLQGNNAWLHGAHCKRLDIQSTARTNSRCVSSQSTRAILRATADVCIDVIASALRRTVGLAWVCM